MYGGKRRLAGRVALEPQAPAALAEVLERARPARAAVPAGSRPRRPREPLPLAGSVQPLEEEHLGLAAAGPLQPQPRRHDTRVVDDDELAVEARPAARGRLRCRIVAARAVVDEQPRLVAPLGRVLRDQLRRQRVLELGALHPTRTLAFLPMDEGGHRTRAGTAGERRTGPRLRG